LGVFNEKHTKKNKKWILLDRQKIEGRKKDKKKTKKIKKKKESSKAGFKSSSLL